MKQLKYRSAAFLLSAKLDPSAIERVFRNRPLKPSSELNYVNKSNIKLAVIQMEVRPYRSLSEWISHLQDLVTEAQENGAQMISFPEYVGLLPLLISPTFCDLAEDFFDALEERKMDLCREILDFFKEQLSEMLFSCYYNTFALLANRSKLYIHAGSTLLFDQGKLRERCFLFGPDGEVVLEQDKLFLSQTEKDLGICPGHELELCDTSLGRIAILPGADSSYFEPAKVAYQLGAQIALCPVSPIQQDNEVAERCGPWMRCQEQALYALTPRLVGKLGTFHFCGKSAIFAPYEATRMSKNGIVCQCAQNDSEAILFSRVNLDYLDLPVDLYASDSNPEFSRQLAAAYSNFPQPLEHLEPIKPESE